MVLVAGRGRRARPSESADKSEPEPEDDSTQGFREAVCAHLFNALRCDSVGVSPQVFVEWCSLIPDHWRGSNSRSSRVQVEVLTRPLFDERVCAGLRWERSTCHLEAQKAAVIARQRHTSTSKLSKSLDPASMSRAGREPSRHVS
eukprot:TRINITY_DN27877_c0_g1_i2.p1 TRINITY_DN27877_c0_g1~~TRINITY_DN27877_c0_g1_i2.p1  ORF type:complete len:145 (-),score=13.47 TRINITY_DN27877_c0_g1_i2:345-779(-)